VGDPAIVGGSPVVITKLFRKYRQDMALVRYRNQGREGYSPHECPVIYLRKP
jgi:hypothetical protein